MRRLASGALLCALLAGPAHAQLANPYTDTQARTAVAPDISSTQAAIMAAMPQPNSTIPQPEAVGGAVGASTAYLRADAKLPRITRAGSCVTDSSGSCTVTWGTALPATNPNIIAEVVSSTQYFCQPTTTPSATSATVKCGSPAVNLLTLAVLTSGQQSLGGTTAAPAGLTVQVTALPRTEP